MDQDESRPRRGTQLNGIGHIQSGGGPVVWIVPFPHVTHLNCFFHFALQLARHGLSIRFFCLDEEIRRFENYESQYLLKGLNFHFHSIEFAHATSVKGRSYRDHLALVRVQEAVAEFMRSEVQSGRKPACFISDLWFLSARELATDNGIPAWMLAPYSSAYLSVISYMYELQSRGILNLPTSSEDEDTREELISFPGLPHLRIREMPNFYFSGHPAYRHAVKNAQSAGKCDVILLSSFFELESRSFRELERFLKALAVKNGRGMPHIYHVGPTFDFLSYSNERTEEGEKHPALAFMDTKAASSVLLVIFGTLVNLSEEQIVEIAVGLENSGQPFLCALSAPRQGDDIFSVIPSECVERTKGRGLFVQGWVPQMRLLAHPATGGFVSHCGHNSMLESLSMGVPILAWPVNSDQFINCRFIVDDANVALEVLKGPGGLVDRKEIEDIVKALFHTEEGATVRRRAKEIREAAVRTVGENGNSRKNIQFLVSLIRGQVV